MKRIAQSANDMDFNAIAYERRIASRHFILDYELEGRGMNHLPCFARHSHSALEVIYVVSGGIHIECGGESFICGAGELVVFNPFELHYGYLDRELPRVDYFYLTVELSALQWAVIASNRALVADLISQKRFIANRFSPGELTRELYGLLEVCAENYALSQENPVGSYLLLGSAATAVGRLIEHGMLTQPTESSLSTRKFVMKMNAYIEENYARETDMPELLGRLSWTQVHFCRVFKASYGMTFSRYLREYRLQKALSLISGAERSPGKLREIAEQVGFSDYAYFSRAFKEYHGISPSEYLERSSDVPADSGTQVR